MLAGIRGAKSTAKVGQKTEATLVEVTATQSALDLLALALEDVRAAGRVTGPVETRAADGEIAVQATLDLPD